MGWRVLLIFLFLVGIFFPTLIFLSPNQVNESHGNDNIQYCIQNDYSNVDFLDIGNLNNFLSQESFLSGKVIKYMTPNLQIAIKNFQRFAGIRVDGIIGPSTFKAMSSFNNCTRTVEAELIDCSGYLAYKECTFFVNAKYEASIEPPPVTTTTVPPPVCDDETFKPYTLYTSSGEGNTVMSCRNEREALASGYIYYANPNPPPQNSETVSSLIILNLNATISIDENQNSVVTVDATGRGGLTYSLSGTDAHLMSISGSGVITLNSNADYEQKTSYSASATVTDSVGSSSKTLSVSVADITEYPTINVRSWYDDLTLPFCTDNIVVNNAVVCGIRTPTLLASEMDNTELWQNHKLSSSDANLRVNILTPSEWTSLTSTESNYITAGSFSSLQIFAGSEQINKDRVRYGIYTPHLVDSWDGSCSSFVGPSVTNHMRSRGVINSNSCYAHELGHSLGLLHAVNQGSNPASYVSGTYNYGYYDSTNNIGTTMSYDGSACFFYSNPDRLCPTQAEKDSRENAGLYDPSFSDTSKSIDGTWGSIPAGSSQADSARYIDENVLFYERLIPKTNYGENIGTDYVSTLSLLPQFNGASASYSYSENVPGLTTPDTLTMYTTVGSDVTENSVTYKNVTWCSVQNCDIIYGSPFLWESKTGNGARIGYQFYLNQGNLYLRRAKPIYEFATNYQGDHINYITPCLQVNKYMKVGEYIETDCTSTVENTFFNLNNYDNWNFTNVVSKELVVTSYGAFDAYKIITSHSKFEYGINGSDYSNPLVDHNKLIFWVAPNVGIIMFEDEQHRRWKLTAMDSDGDGTDNKTDTDDDNDGVLDVNDALPLDPNSSTDDNNDGRADEDE
tara:strand:+ start:770 stop:3313 length:2544 start_codon:yes stop_codon:yes gene_type:complete